MNSANQGGRGMGMGRGGGRGRMGGNKAGSGGNCLCPQCGHRQAHERALPCTKTKCPQCGTMMIRA